MQAVSQNASVSVPRSVPSRPPRWQLGIALLSFLAASFFGARAGVDFERWVVTALWLVVGLIWIVLWRMGVKSYVRRRPLAAAEEPPAPDS